MPDDGSLGSSLAIILGASAWPNVEALPNSKTFRNSASAFAHYLFRATGLGLPYSHVLDLFDDDGPNTGQLQAIEEFLRLHASAAGDGKTLRNLLVYYVGHGAFVGSGREYILAIRSTRSTENAASSIRMSDLASILLTEARTLRRFIILDCCFAGAAFVEFQSNVSAAVSAQTLDSFPAKGTSLLCAASRRSVALSDDRQGRTMFSGTLIDVLTTGVQELDERLSLTEVGDATWHRLESTFHEYAVRPEVHSPDRREGSVADVPLFPNPAAHQRRSREAEEAKRTELEQRPVGRISPILNIEAVRFWALPVAQRKHLKNLADGRTGDYRLRGNLELELRDLRSDRLIISKPEKHLSRLPKEEFDLADYVELTTAGRRCVEAGRSASASESLPAAEEPTKLSEPYTVAEPNRQTGEEAASAEMDLRAKEKLGQRQRLVEETAVKGRLGEEATEIRAKAEGDVEKHIVDKKEVSEKRRLAQESARVLLYAMISTLIVVWLLGLIYHFGGVLIHVLLLIAIILVFYKSVRYE